MAGGRIGATAVRRPPSLTTRLATPGAVRLLDATRPTRPQVAAGRTGPAARPRSVGRWPALARAVFTPGWPLKYLLVAFPLWWLLGLSVLIFPLMAIPMVFELRRMRPIALPPGFFLWGLFLAWQVIGLLLLDVSPPGTHPGSVSGRIIAIGFSAVEYAGVTVTLLYVSNLPRTPAPRGVSQTAIARWMGWFFLTVCAGGYLGGFAPKFEFRSLTEILLPHSITADAFVKSLVHPVAAQVQDVIGVDDARPAAPFGYTNSWGNALSILLVWFVAGWVLRATGRMRLLYATIATAAIVPVIISLNRGLWIGVGVTVVWVLLRQLIQGRVGMALSAVIGAAVAAAVIALSPLADVISNRLQHGVSDNIRSFVAHLSLVAAKHSPIVGYGGNRHANGSSSSIAVGPTPTCSSCGDVATGSTGQLWAVLFNQGVVGAVLYFGFFLTIICVYWRRTGAINEAALVTVALVFVYMLFYSALPVAPTLTMIAVGVLGRGSNRRADPPAESAVERGS